MQRPGEGETHEAGVARTRCPADLPWESTERTPNTMESVVSTENSNTVICKHVLCTIHHCMCYAFIRLAAHGVCVQRCHHNVS